MARDCLRRPDGTMGPAPPSATSGGGGGGNNAAFDSEYASLMAELGEAPKEVDASKPVLPDLAKMGSQPPWRNPDNWIPPQPIAGLGRGSYSTPCLPFERMTDAPQQIPTRATAKSAPTSRNTNSTKSV
jgi:hypothetical protein